MTLPSAGGGAPSESMSDLRLRPREYPEYERALVVGDSHANTGFVRRAIEVAIEEGANLIIQVGDFGWWPRTTHGQAFIRKVSKYATGAGIDLWFCDGNHEDHDRLPHGAEGPVELADGIVFVPRGEVVTFGNRRFLFFGGAVSVDQAWRTPGVSWFENEVASRDEIERANDAGSFDVVVAHDVPEGTELELTMRLPEAVERACGNHRAMLAELCAAREPELWLGGHYHQRRSQRVGQTRVEVLAEEYPEKRSMAVLELSDLSIRDIRSTLA